MKIKQGNAIIISTSSLQHPLTGIGRYTLELAYGMRHLENILYDRGWNWLTKNNLVDFYQTHSQSQFQFQSQQTQIPKTTPQKTNPIQKMIGHLKRSSMVRKAYHAAQPIWQNFHLRHFNQLDDAIYHGTNFYLPKNFKGKKVVTIHDLSIFKYPQYHPAARVAMMRTAIFNSLKYADHIITPTEYIRQEIAEYFSYPIDKITATHLAADKRYQFIQQQNSELQIFLKNNHLNYKKYVLCVATIEPRKNIDILIEAYLQLPEKLRQEYPLVLAGGYGWEAEKLHQKIEKYQQQGWLKYLKYVPEFNLPHLMNGAKAFAFPSVYEGFGLPVVEAMQCGIPVLVSKNTCLEEVAGGAGMILDANQPHEWAYTIQNLLEDDFLSQKMQAASIQQAQKFSWQQTIQKTQEVYRLV